MRVRSARRARCMSRSTCSRFSTAGMVSVTATLKAEVALENAQTPKRPTTPVIRASAPQLAMMRARIDRDVRRNGVARIALLLEAARRLAPGGVGVISWRDPGG